MTTPIGCAPLAPAPEALTGAVQTGRFLPQLAGYREVAGLFEGGRTTFANIPYAYSTITASDVGAAFVPVAHQRHLRSHRYTAVWRWLMPEGDMHIVTAGVEAGLYITAQRREEIGGVVRYVLLAKQAKSAFPK